MESNCVIYDKGVTADVWSRLKEDFHKSKDFRKKILRKLVNGIGFSKNSKCYSIIFIAYRQKKGGTFMDCMKELMRYSYMLIYKVGEYTGEVRDGELKELLQHHLPYMLQAYNEQVNFQEGENVQHITCEPSHFIFMKWRRKPIVNIQGYVYCNLLYFAFKTVSVKVCSSGS